MSQALRENNTAILESWQTAALRVFVCWNKYVCQKPHLSFTPEAKLPQMWIVLIEEQTCRVVTPLLFRKVFCELAAEMAAETELPAELLPLLLYL